MATTWSTLDDWSVRATCTTGTESAPSTATAGLDLAAGTDGSSRPVKYYEVHVRPSGAGTALTVGTLDGYMYNPHSGVWAKFGALDVPTGLANDAAYAFAAVEVNPVGRIAFVPTGLGVACHVDILGVPGMP